MIEGFFRRAIRIARKVELTGKGDFKEFYQLVFGEDTILLEVNKEPRGRFIKCTCKNCSIHDSKYWCVYKTALILWKSGVGQ